jgi:hypothetical protein
MIMIRKAQAGRPITFVNEVDEIGSSRGQQQSRPCSPTLLSLETLPQALSQLAWAEAGSVATTLPANAAVYLSSEAGWNVSTHVSRIGA